MLIVIARHQKNPDTRGKFNSIIRKDYRDSESMAFARANSCAKIFGTGGDNFMKFFDPVRGEERKFLRKNTG